jgi:uncharacterized membrane protein
MTQATPPVNTSPNGAVRPPAGEPPSPAPAPSVAAREPRPAQVSTHLSANVAAALSYLFGWVSGLVLLLVDKRPFVRYHAAQSVVVFGTLSLLLLIFGDFFLGTFLPQAGGALLLLRRVVELVWLVAAVVLMLKASSGERYRVPLAAPHADRAAGTKG